MNWGPMAFTVSFMVFTMTVKGEAFSLYEKLGQKPGI